MSLRTVRHWDAGRNRVPWSVVRLLRILRLGDLGALQGSWEGWIVNRNGLFSPDGRRFDPMLMTRWWLTQEQAGMFRRAYDEGRLLSAGVGRSPSVTLQPEVVQASVVIEALPPPPVGALLQLTSWLSDRKVAGALIELGHRIEALPVPTSPERSEGELGTGASTGLDTYKTKAARPRR